MVKAAQLDFTNVKDGGGQFSKTNMPAGDYLAKVTKVEEVKAKADGGKMWLFTIQLKSRPSATYPYYCKLVENQLWKIRNLFVAAGINVPKKKIKVDPSKVIGKEIAVSLEDDEYEGKVNSVVNSVFPAADLEAEGPSPDLDDEDDEEEDTTEEVEDDEDEESEDEDEESEDEDDEDEEEEEEEEPAPKKKAKAKKAAPAKKSKKKSKKTVDDDELDELEIDDI